LMYSYTLRDLCNLIFDLQHAVVVVVDPLNGSCKFWGWAISMQDVNE
jgi:hypothetical protein